MLEKHVMFLVTNVRHFVSRENIFPVSLLIIPTSLWGSKFNMAAVEGSLEEEALKRRERLKAMRKKSGLGDEQVHEMRDIFF